MLNIAILISGNGSNLQAIINAIADKKINVKIAAVISNKSQAFGIERAKKHGIDSIVLPTTEFATKDAFDQKLMQLLQPLNVDIIVLAGFMQILTAAFVNHYKNRIINLHPSLLPLYPGTNTHARVLQDKQQQHGCSIHIVTPELDAGPVLAQATVPVYPTDTAETLKQRVQQQEHLLYPKVLGLIGCEIELCPQHGIKPNDWLPVTI